MENCIFCQIAKKSAPSSMVFESENVVAFKSISPVAQNHILITPKRHIENFLKLDSDSISQMYAASVEIISKNKWEEGYKLVFNGGKYQAVGHVHWHLLAGEMFDKNDTLNNT